MESEGIINGIRKVRHMVVTTVPLTDRPTDQILLRKLVLQEHLAVLIIYSGEFPYTSKVPLYV